MVNVEHPAEGIVPAGLIRTLLGVDPGASDRQGDQAFDGQQHANDAAEDDDRAHVAALAVAERQVALALGDAAEQRADPLAHGRRLNEQGQQGAAGWVHGEGDDLIGLGLAEILHRVGEASGGLTGQFDDGAVVRIVVEILAVADQGEGADPHHVGFLLLTAQQGDGGREAGDAPGFRHLALQFEPQVFHFLDGGQLAGGAHLGRQLAEPVAAIGELGGDQRAFKEPASVAGHLLQNAEQLTQGAEAPIKLLLQVADADFVLVELGLEPVRAPFLTPPLRLGVVQHLRLARPVVLEALFTLAVLGGLHHPALLDVAQQLVQGAGLIHLQGAG